MQLANLSPFEKGGIVRAVIETPKGSRNKISYDLEEKIFRLKKLLPQGMVFPYDFGFVPQTRGNDGDPLDILVLLPDPVPAGCVISCRLIGVIRSLQSEKKGKPIRNDRFIGAVVGATEFEPYRKPADLPPGMLSELEEFFVNYNRLEGRRFRVLSVDGPKTAHKMLRAAIRQA